MPISPHEVGTKKDHTELSQIREDLKKIFEVKFPGDGVWFDAWLENFEIIDTYLNQAHPWHEAYIIAVPAHESKFLSDDAGVSGKMRKEMKRLYKDAGWKDLVFGPAKLKLGVDFHGRLDFTATIDLETAVLIK